MHRLSSIEIIPKSLTVTLRTKEGFMIASKDYDTMPELMAGVARINALLLKNHPKNQSNN